MKGFRRIYRLRFLSAFLLCLPGICLALWYAWTAFANFDRYRRAAGEDRSLTQEDFHIQLFDLLGRDLRRMGMKDVPNKSRVPHLSLHLAAKDMDTLLKGAEQESKRPYADAMLERRGQVQKIKIRLRGSQHWHLLGAKKSYKIKLPKGELFDGHRVFNLVNDPMPMKVGEQLVLDLVRDLGVLAPESSFVRLELNGKDLGLMHFLAQPDESVLRNNRRMPGSIYSGNLPSSAKTEELWRDAKRWKKVAWRNDEEKDSRADLERLLHMIHG
ncbi:MAG: CotH kinase family protein, partial [Deltaproteobacteria bacterium]|nr:CotH kinase family protein [Deltaproteobacteria bacterium]